MNRRGADRVGPLGGSGVVSLWGASSLIESIQYGTVSLNNTSDTATITAVDVTRSVVFDLRQSNNWSGGTAPAYTSNTLTLTNSTTVTAARNATGGIAVVAAFVVVQFRPGVFRSVQYGLVSGNGSPTQTITEVNTAKSVLMMLGLQGDSGGRDDAFYARGVLTNGTTLTFTRGASAGSGNIIGWTVMELF